MIRIVKVCRDGRRRNVSLAKIVFIGEIPALTFNDFEEWFMGKFGTKGRWSIIKMGRRSKKPRRVALFEIHRNSFIGDCSRLKRSLTFKQKRLENLENS